MDTKSPTANARNPKEDTMLDTNWTPLHEHACAVKIDNGELVCAPMMPSGDIDEDAAYTFMPPPDDPIIGDVNAVLGLDSSWYDMVGC